MDKNEEGSFSLNNELRNELQTIFDSLGISEEEFESLFSKALKGEQNQLSEWVQKCLNENKNKIWL